MLGVARRIIVSVCMLASPTIVSAQSPAVDDGRQKRVLVLHELGRESTTSVSMDDIYRGILGKALGRRLDYYSEYVDRFRFDDPRYEPALRTYLQTRYAEQPFDVVIPTTTATFRLARHGTNDMFPGAPIVFHAGKGVRPEHNSTGVGCSV